MEIRFENESLADNKCMGVWNLWYTLPTKRIQ